MKFKEVIPILVGIFLFNGEIFSQVRGTDTITNEPLNSAQNIIAGNGGKRVTLGAYAQVDYNQPFNDTAYSNGKLDVHRMVIFMGYKFNDRVHFVTEVEFEHVKEVFVEQAFLNYRFNQAFNFRAGLMLIPMGIINEYHEPTTYNGVERPNLDGKIIPTTWREMGAGFTGTLNNLSLKYQVYAVNGFNSYNGGGVLRGSDGLRKGRQKGAESFMTSPNVSAKVDYYGTKGLKIGASGYYGNTQSTAYNGLLKNDTEGKKVADSTIIGLAMLGIDFRYTYKSFQARGQFIMADISNTEAYNVFTGKDLGSSMLGYYAELGYDVLSIFKKDAKEKLVVFGRYEFYDTHKKVTDQTPMNNAYERTDITVGLTYHVGNGAAFKADYQLFDNKSTGNVSSSQLNFGIGIWF